MVNVFTSLTSSIRARDLVEPLGPPLSASMSFEDADDVLISACVEAGFAYDIGDRVSLVFEDDRVVGWYTVDMRDRDVGCVRDACSQIYPSEIVAGDTSAFKLVHLMASRPRSGIVLFVLDEDAIVGTVSPFVFHAPLFRICLFSLTLELETAALNAALVNPLASWNALSEGRRAKAQEIFGHFARESRRPMSSDQPPIGDLLSATTFADKGKIIAKRQLLANRKRGDVESLFAKAERIRNWCAHTRYSKYQSPLGGLAADIASFIEECLQASVELANQAMKTDAKRRRGLSSSSWSSPYEPGSRADRPLHHGI